MRGPSLQKTALVSFGLHLTVFLVTFLVLRQSSHIIIPSPYMVNLVNPDVPHQMNRREVVVPRQKKQETVPATEKYRKKIEDTEKERDVAKEREMVEKKIAAIATKRKIEAIEKTFKQRSVISLKAHGDNKSVKPIVSNTSSPAASSASQGTIFDDYYAKVIKEIWEQWRWNPELGRKDIEAVVSIKILKDGTAIVQRIEKSSGNSLFDRSALRALALASPLSPPPYEIELGVRFYP